MENDLLTTSQVAERIGVTVRTVNRWVAAGRLEPAITFPGHTGPNLFRHDAVDDFLSERTPEQAS